MKLMDGCLGKSLGMVDFLSDLRKHCNRKCRMAQFGVFVLSNFNHLHQVTNYEAFRIVVHKHTGVGRHPHKNSVV